jgi:hypothetical protein
LYVAVALGIWKLFGLLPFVFVALFAAPVIFTPRERSRELRALKSTAAYLALSIVTLPFLDSVWLGELPVLALPQIPKAELCDAIQSFIIAEVMPRFGLSRGPDRLI